MHLLCRLLFAASLTTITATAVAQDYPAVVATYAVHQGGNVIYHYEVRNNGPSEVRRFYIGCDCRGSTGIAELSAPPVGAFPDRSDDTGTWYTFTPNATRQPAGWRVRMIRPRGAKGHWLEWYMPAARPNAGIAPGRTLGGFSLVLSTVDETYLNGRYTVQPEGGRLNASGSLALLDTTPPTLSLETQTTPANAGSTAFMRVIATAKDDRDPEPRVVVESAARADGVDESAYIVHYSATDASGNRTTASTRVRLPAPPVPQRLPPPTPPMPENSRPPAGPIKFPATQAAVSAEKRG